MEDWNDMLPVQKKEPLYRIQWSPTGKVRAKNREDTCWKIAKCSKACYAESVGYALLQEGKK